MARGLSSWGYLSIAGASLFVSEELLPLVIASECLWIGTIGGNSPSWSPVPDGVSLGKIFSVERVYSGRSRAGALKLFREELLGGTGGSLATTLKE